MAQIVWTRQALDDLTGLIDYIAADKPSVARRFARQIIRRVEYLRRMPLMGAFIAEDERKIYRELRSEEL